MDAGGGKSEDHIAFRDVGAWQDLAALDRADREAGEIVIVAVIEPRHLGGLAADQRAAGLPAAESNAGDDGRADFRLEFTGGVIVEEEQRLGALHYQVIDAHGAEIDAGG